IGVIHELPAQAVGAARRVPLHEAVPGERLEQAMDCRVPQVQPASDLVHTQLTRGVAQEFQDRKCTLDRLRACLCRRLGRHQPIHSTARSWAALYPAREGRCKCTSAWIHADTTLQCAASAASGNSLSELKYQGEPELWPGGLDVLRRLDGDRLVEI